MSDGARRLSRLTGIRLTLFALLLITSIGVAAPRDGPPVPKLAPVSFSTFRPPTIIGWPQDKAPVAPPGFIVHRYAEDMDSPRWLLVLPNDDVLVSQSRTESLAGMPEEVIAALTRTNFLGPSANNIVLLQATPEGISRSTLIEQLNLPHGMLLLGEYLYVANTDALIRFPFQPGQTRIEKPAKKILAIPAGEQTNYWNNHWTRNVVASADGEKLYLTVGAGTNANENGVEHPERAAIWELNPDGTGKRMFATGLRNPVGIDWEPVSGELWTTVNERDSLGEDVPPDFLTRVVDGAFYGWPYVYYGTYPDPFHAQSRPDEVAAAQKTARVPDLALGGHSVPLGLRFYRGGSFPEKYRHGAFIARRGGVGRAEFLGYDVVFIPFENGAPTGVIEPFLSGFIADGALGTVHGRPVGVAEMVDGSLLISDDAGNTVWRVSYVGE
jgi:glucose/arabinose dehydrogenase